MPIFSLRSVRRMLDELAPSLSPHRVRELEAKMRARNDQTVPSEWEIAVGYALSRVGKVIDPGSHRPGNPDFIFIANGSSKEIVVEVTALSDQNADRENAIDDFTARLHAVAASAGITQTLGTFSWKLGDAEVNGRIIIGIPDRRDIDAFFKANEFKGFLHNIKASPLVARSFQFEVRGSKSEISFSPGRHQFASGGHRSYKVARAIDDAGVFNRLKSKEKQLSKAALNLPAIVFLCDNDSHLLRHDQLNAPGTFKIEDIVTTFLDGRRHWQQGPWILQQGMPKHGNRVHAVVTLTVNQPWQVFGGQGRRELRGRFIPASHCASHIQSTSFLELINAAVEQLPAPVATPCNAMNTYRWPPFFGGGAMTGNKVKISLLTLQKLIVGEMSYDEFARGHDMLATQMRRLATQGQMISGISIEHQRDADDDWVVLEFDETHPDRLFDARKS